MSGLLDMGVPPVLPNNNDHLHTRTHRQAMSKILFIVSLIMLTSACVPTSYEALPEQQSPLESFWQKSISTDITQYSCIVCHHSESIASETDYVLLQNNVDDYLDKNLEITLAYLEKSEQHGQLFLSKSRGLDHTQVLNVESDKYLTLQSFVEMATQQDEIRASAISYYKASLSDNLMQTQCLACHVEEGLAASTGLVLTDANTANHQDINANRVINFASLSNTNFDNVLLKATGFDHAGGEVVASDSEEAGFLMAFLSLLNPSSTQ